MYIIYKGDDDDFNTVFCVFKMVQQTPMNFVIMDAKVY